MATRLLIQGVVQGVGFRYALAREADALGLQGWVRNLADGAVEACVKGPDDAVAALAAWARRGPPAARVAQVTRSDADDGEVAEAGFRIAATR